MTFYHTYLSLALAVAVSIICLSISLTEALKNGFSVELIHRDSVKSPFFNPTETPYQKIINALKRSRSRANHFYRSTSKDSAQSDVSPHGGEYLMTYSVGTPPFEAVGIVDTGSDLTWLQCKPCKECYKQETPLFDPSKSTSYIDISCNSTQCNSVSLTTCSRDRRRICQYNVLYGDFSYTKGDIASETITFGSTSGRAVPLLKIIMGCGHNNGGIFDPKEPGVVGLSRGTVSIVTQMGSSIGGKFSYCLQLPTYSNVTSKLNFGESAVVSGAGSVSTPIVRNESDSYYLILEGFSVGAKRLHFVSEIEADAIEEGNIIIDAGTILTVLPTNFYSKLESEVAALIKARRVQGPLEYRDLLCYSSTSESFDPPIITTHFRGADVKLNPENTFFKVSDDTFCFAFAPTGLIAIYGNIVQMNFLVGYDLQKSTMSFKPTDCTHA